MRVAIVGSGISGLGAAHALTQKPGVLPVVFEAEARLGGHSHTVEVTLEGQQIPVDTGFLVFNDRTYPKLIALFDKLGVDSAASEMSFAVRNDVSGLEWAGTNFATLFADPRNLIRHTFWRMLLDISRFNRAATSLALVGQISDESLAEYLRRNRYSAAFMQDYLLPMAACIWSSPKSHILNFPLSTFVHFFHNHGLLSVTGRPQWRTVMGGSREYVKKLAAVLPDVRANSAVTRVERDASGVSVMTADGAERFDAVVFACHSDQALALLAWPTQTEQKALSAIAYQPNTAVLHTDRALMPTRRRAWSAWNYLVQAAGAEQDDAQVSLTYWINALQPLACKTDVFVTLNPARPPDTAKTLRTLQYAHPLLNSAAVHAQQQIENIQGENRTVYAGAWLGYGFHEDGLASGQRAAKIVRQLR